MSKYDPDKADFERKKRLYKPKASQLPIQYSTAQSTNTSTRKRKGIWYTDPFIKWIEKSEDDFKKIDVYVFSSYLYCEQNGHDLDFYKTTLSYMNTIPSGYDITQREEPTERKHTYYLIYCKDCNKFFIDYTQIECSAFNYNAIPNLNLKYSLAHDYNHKINFFTKFNQVSYLALYGYRARKYCTDEYRHNILYNVIYYKRLTRGYVVSHLQNLIGFNRFNPAKKESVEKYRNDILYVHETFGEYDKEIDIYISCL